MKESLLNLMALKLSLTMNAWSGGELWKRKNFRLAEEYQMGYRHQD
jgi:hypothetical protein